MTDNNGEWIPAPEDLGEDAEALGLVDEAEDQLNVENSEVTTEDLSVSDRIDDGADPMEMATTAGVYEELNGVDDATEESIDQRVLQEEYEPGSAIVPPPRGDVPELGERDL